MRGVNKVTLIGNLGADPDVRATASGTRVANLSIATTGTWQRGEERGEKTEWHRVVLFGRMAEVAEAHLHKGDTVYVEGRLQTRKWEDRQGNERYTTEILGKELVMLGRPGKRGGKATQPDDAEPEEPLGDDDVPF